MSLCQRPGASSALVSLHELPVCETTGQPASDKILPPHFYTHTHLNHLIFMLSACVSAKLAHHIAIDRCACGSLTHTAACCWRGDTPVREALPASSGGNGKVGLFVSMLFDDFTLPSRASNAAGPQSSRARFSFGQAKTGQLDPVFGELVDGLRFSFDGRHQVVPLAQPRASFRARDGGCGEIAHPLSPSHPKRTCVVQEQDMHANPDP